MELLAKHFELALETPDGIKKLRELILSLAMQGKLGTQNPKDQPASELQKEIEEERKKSDQGGRAKKRDALPAIKIQEIPFELPENWVWIRLGALLNVKSSKRIFEKDYCETGIPFYRSKEIGELSKTNNCEDRLFISDIKYDEICKDYGVPKRGDILLTSVGSIGGCWIVDDRRFYYKDGNVTQIETISQIYNRYIVNFIKSSLFVSQVSEKVSGTAYNALTIIKIKELLFPLSPLAEQKRIVDKIDQLMTLCDKLEAERNERDRKQLKIHLAAIDKLLSASDKPEFNKSRNFITTNFSELYSVSENVEELKKAILQLAMMGKLVPRNSNDQPAGELLKEIVAEKNQLIKEAKIKKQDLLPPIREEEIPYEIPYGWIWVRLGTVGTSNIGLTYSPKDISDTGLPVLRSNNIQNGKLDLNNLVRVDKKVKDNILVHDNDLLICARNGSKALVGKAALIRGLKEDMAFGAFMAIFRSPINEFIWYFINSPLFRKVIDDVTTTTINQITQSNLNNTIFPLPPLAEQKRIVAKIDQLMGLCNTLQKQLNDSTKKKMAILKGVLQKY